MMAMIEGVYRKGCIELNEIPSGFENGDVVIVYLHKKADAPPAQEPQYIYFGMFAGMKEFTDEDIKAAEFHGDPDDGLDWSGC